MLNNSPENNTPQTDAREAVSTVASVTETNTPEANRSDANSQSPKRANARKRLTACIALALVFFIFVAATVVALCRGGGEESSSLAPDTEQSGDASTVFGELSYSVSESSQEESDISEYSEVEELFPEIEVITPENVTAAAIYEAESLYCIYSENADVRLSIASITKLVTASVALEYLPLDTVITAGSELSLVKPDSSVCGLRRGYTLTLEHLLYGLLMSSGNDAAYTVAVSVARAATGDEEMSDRDAVEYFCGLMNGYASRVGATDSSFANPEGWDDENNYSTVADLAVIAKKASENPVIAEISATVKYTAVIESGEEMSFSNSNFLLHEEGRFFSPYATGLKTGSTSGAGKCLVTTVNIDGHVYIAVVMGCPSEETRYGAMLSLIGYIEEYNSLKFA